MPTTKINLTAAIKPFLVFVFLLSSVHTFGQTINGPTTVAAGTTTGYSFDNGITYLWGSWTATGGTVVSSSVSGTNYQCSIQWGAAGAGVVTFKNKATVIATKNVTICSPPATPSTTFTYEGKCFQHVTGEVTVITRAASPPSGETWYWQTVDGGTSTSNSSTTVNATAGAIYYLRSLNSSGCWSVNSLATASIPFAPFVNDASGCSGSSLTVSVGTGTVRWYDACSGGTMFNTTNSYTTPPLTVTTYYYVSQYNATTGAESPRKRVTATILTTPAAITPSSSPATLCSPGGNVALTANGGGANDLLQWFTVPTGGTSFSNLATVNITVNATTTYYLSGKNIYTGCEGPRTPITITVNPIPGVPTIGSRQCTASGVYAIGTPGNNANTIRWYDAATNGTLIGTGTNSPVAATNTTYYAESYNQTTGCWSTRVATTIDVISQPAISNATLCGSGTIPATPGAGGSKVRWYDAPTGGNLYTTKLTSPMTNATTTYYVASFNAVTGCESPQPRPAVTVTIVPLPTVTGNAPILFTYGSSSNLNLTLSTSSYYSYQWKKDGVAVGNAQSYPTNLIGNYTVSTKTSASSIECTSLPVNVGNLLTNQPTPINFVSSTRIYKEGVTASTSLYSLAPKDLVQTVAYQDGLGRTFQTVAMGQSAQTEKDIIAPVAYGKNGIMDSTFLPYVSSVREGKLRMNAIRGGPGYVYSQSEQFNFYQGTALVATDASPFARSIHKSSLDARVIEQGAPGANWQPLTTPHTVANSITLNDASMPVRYWKPDGTTAGNYPNNTVAVTTITDENGNKVRTYTNKQGQTVLKQVELGETINGTMTNWLETYYIYDVYGRLVYQVPPKATALIATANFNIASNSATDSLVFKYGYDSLGRVVEKTEPGAAVKYIVYDQMGRVVMTQDAKLRENKQWMYIKYDRYHRPVYSGIYTNTQKISRKAVQGIFIGLDYSTQPYFESPSNSDPIFRGYSNASFPTSNITVLTANYYDGYDFDQNATPDFAYQNNHIVADDMGTTLLPTTASAAVRNLPTGSGRSVLDGASWLTSATFYDQYDRPLQSQAYNHLNNSTPGVSSVVYADRAGHVEKTKHTHQGPSGSVSVQQSYAYDNTWRTTAIYHSINGAAKLQVAGYTYNVLGQLVDKKLHVVNGTPLQSIDLRYNIRGWLKSINNSQLSNDSGTNNTNDDTGDYFGMELLYHTTEVGLNTNAYHNGNVAAVKWKAVNTNTTVLEATNGVRGFSYLYDKSDKLKTASFVAQDNSGAWAKQANTLNETMSYDHSGNILTLSRTQNERDMTNVNSQLVITSSQQIVDNLTYTYPSNSNRMRKVEDTQPVSTGVGDFKNATDNPIEYSYDKNGSLTKDDNKGIQSITYNDLGKPKVITYSGTPTKSVTYTYDAAGVKLRTVTVADNITTTTDYIGGFVYTNGALSFFSSPEGRVVKTVAGYEYQYAIADHQGNTRMIFTSATPTVQSVTATSEVPANDALAFGNVPSSSPYWGSRSAANHTPNGIKVIALNQNYKLALTKSVRVYPGDKVDLNVFAYYEAENGYGTTNQAITAMITNVATAFGGVNGGAGEAGRIYNGVNSAFSSFFSVNANQGDGAPSAHLNYILFDQQYKVLSAGWKIVPSSAKWAQQEIKFDQINVQEAGFIFVYLTYSNQSNNLVYFDDLTVKVTPTNIVQYNEYYAYGLSTANSWTRENNTGNYFLYNGGTELNTTTGVMDLFYRNYDPVLGRMNQVDPMAGKYANATPYNYAFNSPTNMNDPMGDAPNGRCSWCNPKPRPIDTGTAGGGGGGDGPFAGLMGRSAGFFEPGWQPGSGSLSAGTFGRSVYEDARDVRNGSMSLEAYAAKYGSNLTLSDMALTMAAITGSSVIGNTIASMTYGGLFSFQVNGKDYGGNFVVINGSVESLAFSYSLPTDIGGLVARGNTILVDVGPGQSYQSALNSWANNARGADMMGLTLAGGGAVLSMTEDMFRGVGANLRLLQNQAWDMGMASSYGNSISKVSKIATSLQVSGYGLGAFNAVSIERQYRQGTISGWNRGVEQGSNTFSTLSGLLGGSWGPYGAAWGVGWELGRAITNVPSYQEWKNSTWLPFREKYLGY